jgi:hypothetical protein
MATILTMKWSDRIAQGFNPGLKEEKRALKVAPEVGPPLVDRSANNLNTRFGRHFQGASYDIIPRAEALGYSLRPFHGQNQLPCLCTLLTRTNQHELRSRF